MHTYIHLYDGKETYENYSSCCIDKKKKKVMRVVNDGYRRKIMSP